MKPLWIVLAVVAALNLYLAFSLRSRLPIRGQGRAAFTGLFLVFAALQFIAPLFDWSLAPFRVETESGFFLWLARASYLALGVMSCLLVYTLVCDVGGAVAKILLGPLSARRIDRWSLKLIFLATFINVAVGLSFAGRTDVVRVDLPVRGLPPAFEGFKIVQISDIHIGPFLGRGFVQQVVEKITALDPDIVMLTGDLADGTVARKAEAAAPLAQLAPRYGKYFVTGNHEYYWDAPGWVEAARKLGFTVLMNEHILAGIDGSQLVVAGVPDPTSSRIPTTPQPDPQAAALGAPAQARVKILLAHQPMDIETAKQAGFTLQLSGHTHSGQYFPYTAMIRLFQPYHKGLYAFDDFSLYVNKGTGFWGPPLRTNGAGEITLLTLRAQ